MKFVTEWEKALMIFSFDIREILLNMCNSFITSKTILGVIVLLVSFIKYKRPRIFKYDFDWGRWELSIRSQLIFSDSLRMFLIMNVFDNAYIVTTQRP